MGQIITGAIMSGYSFIEILRYPKRGALPPFFGDTPMAFTTAVLLFLCGLAWFWNGMDKRMNGYQPKEQPFTFTGADVAHVAAAAISALAALIVGLIAILK